MTRKQCFIFLLFLLFLSFVWSVRAHDIGGGGLPGHDLDYDFVFIGGYQPEEYQEQFYSDDQEVLTNDQASDIYVDQSETIIVNQQFSFEFNNDQFTPPSRSVWCSAGVPVIGTIAATVFVAFVAGSALERWAENFIINDVLSKYDQSLAAIGATDEKLLRLAYHQEREQLADFIEQLIVKYGHRIFTSKKRQWLLPVLTELYLDKAPTKSNMANFCTLLAEQ